MPPPPPNSPVSIERTYTPPLQSSAQPAAFCPVEDLVHAINEIFKERMEIFEKTSIASMKYLLSLEYRKFQRLK